ncbi:hypothetical protein BKA69DRAFT_1121785 [Paraphysoderma sedebokerense]|nr:hypothetical protein BKA69DRAFT_1121785 [Paraphysoderma sedebokerense]
MYHLSLLIRFYFLIITATVILIAGIPQLCSLLHHGKSLHPKKIGRTRSLSKSKPKLKPSTSNIWSIFLGLHVSKDTFYHFYVLGSLWCGIHLVSLYSQEGSVVRSFTRHFYNTVDGIVAFALNKVSLSTAITKNDIQPPESSQNDLNSNGFTTTVLLFSLYQIHLARRLYEQLFIFPKTKSKMHIGHYLLGITFYVFIVMALWVDLVPLSNPWNPEAAPFRISTLTVSQFTFVIVFLVSNWMQHMVHRKLAVSRASLKGIYHLPTGPYFRYIVSPHYFFEIAIYLSLWRISCGQLKGERSLKGTLVYVVIWCIISLSINAHQSWKYYESTVGREKWKQKRIYRILPYIW